MNNLLGPSKAEGPYIDLTHHIIELAEYGEPDSLGIQSAHYKPPAYEGIGWILLRVMDREREDCATIIKYGDETSYSLTLRDARVWDLTHRDPGQARGEEPERMLPYAEPKVKRRDYVCKRFGGVMPVLDLGGHVATGLSSPEAMDTLIEDFVQTALSPEELRLGAFSIAVDPADLNMEALCAPVLSLRPGDKIFLGAN